MSAEDSLPRAMFSNETRTDPNGEKMPLCGQTLTTPPNRSPTAGSAVGELGRRRKRPDQIFSLPT